MSVIQGKGQLLKSAIVKHLYYKKALSLTDLSKLTHKSVPLVTTMVNQLVLSQIIIEQGLAPSTGGRRAVKYLLNPNLELYVIAVATDQLITSFTIYNLSNQKVTETKYLDFDLNDSANTTEKFADFISASISQSGIDPAHILGIGIGVPGFVNSKTGESNSYFPVKQGQTLQSFVGEKTKLPVYVENDSSLIALAELYFGEAKGLKDFLVVNIGWGTGLGMVINGQLYRGSNGYAGEFSHVPLSESNSLCSCGKRGCLEVETSLLVMTRKAQEEIEGGAESIMKEFLKEDSMHPTDCFLKAVVKQDPLAISVLSKAAFQLGKGLATLIHILNPNCIILSGRGAKAGKMLFPAIQQAINEFCIPKIAEQTTIKLSSVGSDAGLLAAASLVVENSQFE
ncbi:MAG TPA: ROK family protein [Pedobacter sp.]|nr:ROK family protein [Pedobacter sp.]